MYVMNESRAMPSIELIMFEDSSCVASVMVISSNLLRRVLFCDSMTRAILEALKSWPLSIICCAKADLEGSLFS